MSTDDWMPTTADAGAETLDHPLRRMLSLDSRVSSSPAAERDATTQADEANTYRRLGWGACGIVVAQGVKPMAFKFAKTSASGELFNDHKMQHIIAAAFQRVKDNMGHNNTTVRDAINAVRTPRPYFWVPHTEARWFEENTDLVSFVQQSDYCNLPTDVLAMERIFPLPQPTRTALIDKFCPPHLKEAALESPGNKDCLVRVYLGAVKDRAPRAGEGKAPGVLQTFNLRNFKLYLNDMEELRLDVDTLATLMGAALAMLHWAAKTDARDVEFVLGSSRELKAPSVDVETLNRHTYTGPASYIGEDFFHRTTEFWVLD